MAMRETAQSLEKVTFLPSMSQLDARCLVALSAVSTPCHAGMSGIHAVSAAHCAQGRLPQSYKPNIQQRSKLIK